jgi:hypothetical protein
MTADIRTPPELTPILLRKGLDEALEQIATRLQALAAGRDLPPFAVPETSALPFLARVFHLSEAEQELLCLAAGCELDGGMAELVGAVNGTSVLDPALGGGLQTLDSYDEAMTWDAIPKDHIAFVESLFDYWETDTHIFVHANYDAKLSLEQQPDRLLLWEHVAYTLPGRHQSGKTAIVGHTPQGTGEILDLGYLICIDTYCFGGGWLTALDVESGKVWQANRDGELRW